MSAATAWPTWTLSQVAAPAVEPVTLDDVKGQIRVTTTDEDVLLQMLIQAGRQYAEAFTGRSFITQTWELWLEGFPAEGWIPIPRAPLQTVDAIVYVEPGGARVIWDPARYQVEAPRHATAQRGRVLRPYATAWPITQAGPGAVTVRFTAGYGATPDDVPAELRVAIKEWVCDGWQQRGNLVYGPVATAQAREWLLWPFLSV